MKKICWLSFAADDGPLGACIIEASDTVTATKRSHELKINPGGQVIGVEIDVTDAELEKAKPFMNRLLNMTEARAFDAHMSGEEEGTLLSPSECDPKFLNTVCQGCNEGTCKEHT